MLQHNKKLFNDPDRVFILSNSSNVLQIDLRWVVTGVLELFEIIL